MNNKNYDEELVEIFVKAAGDASSSLLSEYLENCEELEKD